VIVVFGALLFAVEPARRLAADLAVLYLTFNVLLYGGVYALNDVADVESDRQHSLKRSRPIASGAITTAAARRFGTVMILAGLGAGVALLPRGVWACFPAVLAINFCYSAGGRDIKYVDILLNALPHAVRFLMGALLAGRQPPAGHLVTLLLFAIAMSCLRRSVERDTSGWEARQTLKVYTLQQLQAGAWVGLAAMLAMAAAFGREAPGFYSVVTASALVLVAGGHLSGVVRKPLAAIWTR
jgi:4-hydroxybenzoate polyprenyltransferase